MGTCSAWLAVRARASSREAMATTLALRQRCMAGMTFSVAILAGLNTPQRTVSGMVGPP